MKEDGLDPKDIREKLEFSTEFEYKENKVKRSFHPFIIKGNLPKEFILK